MFTTEFSICTVTQERFTQLDTCHVMFHQQTYGSTTTQLLTAHVQLFAVCPIGHVHVGYCEIDIQFAQLFWHVVVHVYQLPIPVESHCSDQLTIQSQQYSS